ncbi:metallophosphoesterase [Akkermansiaceae bacterium]|nr:metallophosphoesterase [Akkermansiaceae bacterium]
MSAKEFLPVTKTRRAFLKATGLLVGSTIAAEKKEPILRFGLLTDPHYADRAVLGTRYYRESKSKMKECIDFMNREKVTFLAELGDLKDQRNPALEEDTLRFLKEIEAVFAGFKGPRYHVLGNHDMDSITKKQFLGEVENTGIEKDRSYFSYDQKGVHFIVLDANYLLDGSDCAPGNFKWTDTHVPEKELTWLAKDLQATSLPVIILAHQRLDGSGTHFVNNSDKVRDILERSGKVLAVFQGHDHPGHHQVIKDIHYYTLKAMVEGTGKKNSSYAIVEVHANHDLIVNGYRRAVDRTMK